MPTTKPASLPSRATVRPTRQADQAEHQARDRERELLLQRDDFRVRRHPHLDLLRRVGAQFADGLLVGAFLDAAPAGRPPRGSARPVFTARTGGCRSALRRAGRVRVPSCEHQIDGPLGAVDDQPAALGEVDRSSSRWRRDVSATRSRRQPASPGPRLVAGVEHPAREILEKHPRPNVRFDPLRDDVERDRQERRDSRAGWR